MKGSFDVAIRYRLKKLVRINVYAASDFVTGLFIDNRLGNMKNVNIVVLTGAGISAESGIQTFRSADGLWEEHRVEDVATPEGFERNPKLVQRFYNERRRQLQQENIKPNAAHYALAQLEEIFGDRFVNYTKYRQFT